MDTRTKIFIEEVGKVYPHEFEILSDYVNRNTKVKVRHIVCNSEYEIYPYDFLKQRYIKCVYCFKQQEILDKLNKRNIEHFNSEFRYEIGSAIKIKDVIKVHHSACNNSFSISITNFLNLKECHYCSGYIFNKQYLQNRMNRASGNEDFVITNNPLNRKENLVIKHLKCDREFETTIDYFVLQFPKCRICEKEKRSKIKKKSHSKFESEFKEIYGDAFVIQDIYEGAHKEIRVMHVNCGTEILVKPNTALSLTFACPTCRMSNPESIIYNELTKYSVDFKIQYKFDDCLGSRNRKIPFDFAIFKEGTLKMIIEYDGEHHFNPIIYGEKSYKSIVKNDAIKNKYCKEKGITLHRIHYSEFKNLKSKVHSLIQEL